MVFSWRKSTVQRPVSVGLPSDMVVDTNVMIVFSFVSLFDEEEEEEE